MTCQIESGQRIGLLGRNGSGKTTLMRILSGVIAPDHGEYVVAPGTKVSLLPQEVPQDLEGSINDVVLHGLPPDELDESHLWQSQQRVDRLLSRMSLDGNLAVSTLSSGMKRRVLLARSLVSEPDVLLLDEPTNHLDIDTIAWLEDFLLRWPATLIFVTHDRAFLRTLATRILEIDRGRLFDWSCDYDTFLVRKEAALAAEEKQNALFDKKLAQEEAWLRQGIKARRTRNEGRVRALKQMRLERSKRREKIGTAKLEIQAAQRSGAFVAKVEKSHSPTASGRSSATFPRPSCAATRLASSAPTAPAKRRCCGCCWGNCRRRRGRFGWEPICRSRISINFASNSTKTRPFRTTLAPAAKRCRSTATRATCSATCRIFCSRPSERELRCGSFPAANATDCCLARLFSKPANVIVLDEPTNDLDTETLELLEERLVEFAGTLLLVSHDRAFLNNVVTSTIVFEAGGVREYVGGYDDWLRQRPEPAACGQRRQTGVREREAATRHRMSHRLGSAAWPITKSASWNRCRRRSKRSTRKLPNCTPSWLSPSFTSSPRVKSPASKLD